MRETLRMIAMLENCIIVAQLYNFNKITELYICRMSRFYGMLVIPQ